MTSERNEQRPRPPGVKVYILVLVACSFVASIGLIAGATVQLTGERVQKPVTEEIVEVRGIVTVPIERVVTEGRVDVTVTRKLLGIAVLTTERLEDIVDVSVHSGSTGIRGSGGNRPSRYSTEAISILTRSGKEWTSESASGVLGTSPSEAAELLRSFVSATDREGFSVSWTPLLENIVGVPFSIVSILVLSGLVGKLRGARGGDRA